MVIRSINVEPEEDTSNLVTYRDVPPSIEVDIPQFGRQSHQYSLENHCLWDCCS
jgi:hypothetical protein